MRTVLTSELYTIVYGLNVKAILKSTIKYILEQFMPMIFYMDLKSLYNCLVKLGTT